MQKAGAISGNFCDLFLGHDGELHGAGREHVQLEHVDTVVIAGVLEESDVDHLVTQLSGVFNGHVVFLREVRDVVVFAQFHAERKVDHFIRQLTVPEDVFPGLLRGVRVENVHVANQFDQVLTGLFATRGPVLFQTLLFAFCKGVG